MTTIEMEIKLMKHFKYTTNYVVPNLTPLSGLVAFETDLLSLTKSGYATGVEIKVSKSDLKNDLSKRHWLAYGKAKEKGDVASYKKRFFKNLKYFYYAVPIELLDSTKEQIPDWVGILVVNKRGVSERRKPTLINSKKWSTKEVFSLLRLGTMRIRNLKYRILENERSRERVRPEDNVVDYY